LECFSFFSNVFHMVTLFWFSFSSTSCPALHLENLSAHYAAIIVFVENSMEKAMANRQGSHVHHS
jgi:hypothetical protein